ncbi:Zn-ribbon domain-containing OB-fold protein [Pseudorhizobium xiangyangii]|uniref:Zn-ribbon domain-containing OB-fold protein n=1 Tax=Pseudorhizobium xiangyangii TaxID=2883104 RepID=UPI0021057627|nr:OB-fold domain-containing protein [Neorhizobium xiangyangii]
MSIHWERVPAAGTAKVVSWVVYHTAYADHLAARIPYNVAVVELDEGPRMLTSIVGCRSDALLVDARIQLKITAEDGIPLPYFVLSEVNEEVVE